MNSETTSARTIESSNNLPRVSVIIPAYNVAAYIDETLRSVFAQTFSDYEVIVINDGSPDTVELDGALQPYSGRITYLKQENRGPSGARNTAIMRARGEYMALLDSDDVWMPDYLAEQMRILQDNSSLDLIYADALLFGDSDLAGRTFMQTAPSRAPVNFESLLRWECSIITTCVVARRQSLIDAGLFDEKFFRCEDFDLWLRLAHRGGKLSFQRQVLAQHRLHGESLAADSTRMFNSQIEVLRKTADTLPLSPDERRLVETQIVNCNANLALEQSKRQFISGEYSRAAQSLARANEFLRSRKLWIALLGMRAAPRLLHRLYDFRDRFVFGGSAKI